MPFSLATATVNGQLGQQRERGPGFGASFSLTLALTGTTFPDAITFSVTGLPTGATATFSPATTAAGSAVTPVTLTIQTANTTTAARSEQPTPGNPLAPCSTGLPAVAAAGPEGSA
jgi:hypothetical protein